MHQRVACAIALCLVVLCGAKARAGDGRIEINQACALGSGCGAGDAPGFPVTIDRNEPASYVLTGNLRVNENTVAIDVLDDYATIDLNGFAILGPTRCTSPGTCGPLGTGVGIRSTYDPMCQEPPCPEIVTTTIVRNGMIIGMGSNGIWLEGTDGGTRVEAVSVQHNGGVGMYLGPGGVVERCSALFNRSVGILSRGLVLSSISRLNGGDGLFNNGIALFFGNIVTNNAGYGVGGSVLTDYFNNALSLNAVGQVQPGVGLGIENSCNSSPCP
jgi:hypothetical protein